MFVMEVSNQGTNDDGGGGFVIHTALELANQRQAGI